MLLVGAGLSIRSFWRWSRRTPVQPRQRVNDEADFTGAKYREEAQRERSTRIWSNV